MAKRRGAAQVGRLPGLLVPGTVVDAMTAKEQLLQRVQTFSEEEAADALQLLDQRVDELTRMLDGAPEDDEPTTPEEEALAQEARDEIARGEASSLDELRAELGLT